MQLMQLRLLPPTVPQDVSKGRGLRDGHPGQLHIHTQKSFSSERWRHWPRGPQRGVGLVAPLPAIKCPALGQLPPAVHGCLFNLSGFHVPVSCVLVLWNGDNSSCFKGGWIKKDSVLKNQAWNSASCRDARCPSLAQ